MRPVWTRLVLQQGPYAEVLNESALITLQTCQATGWREKHHKEDCRLLQDQNLCMLLGLAQKSFTEYSKFEG